jgi:hypothetical protein
MSLRRSIETKRIVLMGDKGQKTTKITMMFPDVLTRPQSTFNQLPLMIWKGSDKHSDLLKASELYMKLKSIGPEVFIGGDTAFLANILGTSCSASFPCICCLWESKKNIYFDNADYPLRTIKQMEEALKKPESRKKERAGVFRKAIWNVEPSQVRLTYIITNSINNLVCSTVASHQNWDWKCDLQEVGRMRWKRRRVFYVGQKIRI